MYFIKKITVILFILFCIAYIFSSELDFCGKTILVVLEPRLSDYSKSLVSDDFFGTFEKESVENISIITNEEAIKVLETRLDESGQSTFKAIYKITLPQDDKAKVLEAIEELKQIEGIESAEPDYIIPLDNTPNDSNYRSLWGLHGTHGIKAPQAWAIFTGLSNVRVGVMDTGIFVHEDLSSNLVTGANFDLRIPSIGARNTTDTEGHGTHVSGTIGAVGNNRIGVVGVNWNTNVVPLRISTNSTGSTQSTISQKAIQYATNTWGTSEQISILNYSYSGYGADHVILTTVNSYPGLFIWSAGNSAIDVDEQAQIRNYNTSNLIAVGSITSSGNRSSFSNYSSSGRHVHIYAPGSDIMSTVPNNKYASYSGTSMAAPHVTGVATLLLSRKPNLTARELKNLIIANADNHTISIPSGRQTVKKLNVFKAIQALGETPEPPPYDPDPDPEPEPKPPFLVLGLIFNQRSAIIIGMAILLQILIYKFYLQRL